MLVCLFPGVACVVPEDDLILSEDEDLEDSQLTTPTANGLNINKLVRNYSLRNLLWGAHCLLILSENGFFVNRYNLSIILVLVDLYMG